MGAVLVALAILAGAAGAVTVHERARLREGPSTTSAQLGTLPVGTEVQVLGDERGWKKVQTGDGQTGWVWAEHLGDAAPTETARRPDPPAGGPRSVTDEVRELRADVAALRDRPPGASAADVERLRAEIDRLATADRDLARRLDDRPLGTGPLEPPAEHPFPAIVAFVAGAFLGLVIGRLTRRRRERRQRGRLAY